MSRLASSSVSRAVLSLGVGLLAAGASHATGTPFSNPFSGTGQSTVYVPAFTATATGTLNAYFVSSSGTGFTDGLGFYSGASPNSTSGAGVQMSSYTNKSAVFGTNMLSINVTQGETFYFVELANETSVKTYNGGANYYVPTGCSSTTAPAAGSACAIDQTPHYIWSDEEASSGGLTSFTAGSGTPPSTKSGYNAMAYVNTTAYANSGPLTNPPGSGTTGNGTIAAGSYTYVGFNDWLGGQSNAYDDVSFLFTISCTAGSAGCGGAGTTPFGGGTVPEPGSLALAALGAFCAVRLGRRPARRAA